MHIYLLKHKTKHYLWLSYIQTQSIFVLIQICMLPLKFYVFSEQGNHTPMKTDGPGDPEFQKASAIVSSKSCILNSFNNAG